MRTLSRHTNALAHRGMRVNRLADVYGICAHFNRQRNLADGEDVTHVGTRLNIDVDEAAIIQS